MVHTNNNCPGLVFSASISEKRVHQICLIPEDCHYPWSQWTRIGNVIRKLSFLSKGQIISKGLFGVLEFSHKTNKWIHRSSKNKFVCSFFGIIRGYQKSFRNFLTFSSDQIYRTYYWNCSSVLCCDRLKFCFYNPGLISFSLCNLWSSCQATN